MNTTRLSKTIKQLAKEQGFDRAGIARARIPPYASYLTEWLKQGRQGEMHWMENYVQKRLDVTKLYPGARSVIVVAHNYFTSHQHSDDKRKCKISRYAWGRDYHKIIKKKLKTLLREIREIEPRVEGRLFVDSAPIQEKLWARQAGLGWQGKNTNVISRDLGSWFFLGELVVNVELDYDSPIADYCGNCRACIEACPTQALTDYRLDARRCLSYLTIEYKDALIPEAFQDKMNNWIFGCDICQDVCPWNRFAKETREPAYFPAEENIAPDLNVLSRISESAYRKRFNKSAVSRAKYTNFIRNIKTVLNKG